MYLSNKAKKKALHLRKKGKWTYMFNEPDIFNVKRIKKYIFFKKLYSLLSLLV
jgi:hypothetical protein